MCSFLIFVLRIYSLLWASHKCIQWVCMHPCISIVWIFSLFSLLAFFIHIFAHLIFHVAVDTCDTGINQTSEMRGRRKWVAHVAKDKLPYSKEDENVSWASLVVVPQTLKTPHFYCVFSGSLTERANFTEERGSAHGKSTAQASGRAQVFNIAFSGTGFIEY